MNLSKQKLHFQESLIVELILKHNGKSGSSTGVSISIPGSNMYYSFRFFKDITNMTPDIVDTI